MSMLEVKALNQFYGGSHTLWDVDLTVPKGSRMCLMGRNGMGKTTLLRCIMGLQPFTSAGIIFDGSDLSKSAAEQRAKLGIGYVPQGREIFPYLTVEENLRIGIGVRKNGVKSIPTRIFDLFPNLRERLSSQGSPCATLRRHSTNISGSISRETTLCAPRRNSSSVISWSGSCNTTTKRQPAFWRSRSETASAGFGDSAASKITMSEENF